jgi:glycerol-3-phosphate dehydrogenase
VSHPVPGLVAVAGGKYTTYRVMARDAFDAATEDLGGAVSPCVTEHTPLLGADGYHALVNTTDSQATRWGLPVWRFRRLVDRYGSETPDVLAATPEDPRLLEPVPGADDYLMAEIHWGFSHEGPLHVDDVLARRTRICIETEHRGVDSAEAVAELAADLLGWDAARRTQEVVAYRSGVDAERASQAELSDEAAIAARLTAVDTRQPTLLWK